MLFVALTTDELLKIAGAFVTLVGGCTLAGRFLAGLIAMSLGKDEELWMRRGEIMFGCVGFGAWITVSIAILSQ